MIEVQSDRVMSNLATWFPEGGMVANWLNRPEIDHFVRSYGVCGLGILALIAFFWSPLWHYYFVDRRGSQMDMRKLQVLIDQTAAQRDHTEELRLQRKQRDIARVPTPPRLLWECEAVGAFPDTGQVLTLDPRFMTGFKPMIIRGRSTSGWNDLGNRRSIYRCSLSNYGDYPLLDLSMDVTATFFEVIATGDNAIKPGNMVATAS